MADAFSTQKNGIIDIVIGMGAIPERFTGVEDEGKIEALLLDSPLEVQQWFYIMNERIETILVTYYVKPCFEKH